MKLKSTLRSFLAIAGSSLLAITYVSAGTYHWDADGDGTAGFGSAAGIWSSAGTGNLWSTSPTGDGVGGTAVADYATDTADDLFFGTSTVPYPTTTGGTNGQITISGTVNAKSIFQNVSHPNFLGTTPTINFAAAGTYETAKGNTAFPASTTISGAATSLTWKVPFSSNLNISNITTNGAAQNILQGPGRLAINSMTPLGASSTPLVFDGGVLRFASGFPFATYPSVTTFNAEHPITFNLNKDAGMDNQIGGSTFTVDVPLNLGTGGFSVEGNGAAIIALNQNNTYTGPTTLTGAITSVETSANLGDSSSNLVFNGGTLRITGTTLTNFSTIGHTVVFTATKAVNLNIDNAGHTFTVDQALNQGIGGITKSGAGTLNLDAAATSSTYSGNTNVTGGIMNLSNTNLTTASVSAGTLVISGTNTHTGLLTCSGTGTLTLSGNNSGAGGGVTLTAGTLNLDSTSALGSGPFTVTAGTINNTVATAGNNTVNFNGSFGWQGATDLTFGNGAITNGGNRTITLNGGPGRTLTFGGVMTNTSNNVQTTTVTGAGNTLVLSGGYELSNNGTSRINVIAGTGNVTITGALTNGGTATASGLAKTGLGTVTLDGNNTYDGLTSVTTAAGTLNLNGDNSGAAGGVTLNFATANLNVNHAGALGSGTVTLTTGIINNTSGSPKTLTTNNLVNLFGTTVTWGGSNNLTFGTGDVQISGAGRIMALTGAGTLTFGGKLINTLANNVAFTVNGLNKTMTAAGLACSNSVSPRIFTVQGDGNLTITTAVQGSSLGGSETIASTLIKNGAGILTLEGNNTYTGVTTVTLGELHLKSGTQESAITVGTGGILGFTPGSPITSSKALTINTGHLIRINAAPVAPNSYTLITAASIGGTAAGSPALETPITDYVLVTDGNSLKLNYTGVTDPYAAWATAKGLTGDPGFENGKTDDPDGDGKNNNFEFAFNGNPLSGSDNGMMAGLVQDASLPAGNELTLVVAVRDGATFANAGTPVVQTATKDGVVYTIEGTLDLVTIPGSDVSHVGSPSNTAPLATGLPDLTGTDWEYHTFKLDASEGLGSKGFLRAKAE